MVARTTIRHPRCRRYMARYFAWERARLSALRQARRSPGVVGVDYGYVYKHGARLKTRGVRFHVHTKLPLTDIPPQHVLPKVLGNLRCDVVEGRYSLHASARDLCDPVEIGVSIGNLDRNSTGTLGMMVRDRHTMAPALLSNWHVLCASPKAIVGDRLGQPGPLHLGSRLPRIAGRLERWIPLSAGFDAAIGLVDTGVNWRQSIFGNQSPVRGVATPQIGMKVMKFGAMSGLTYALVDGIGGAYEIDYSNYGDTTRWLDGIRLVQHPDHHDPEISIAGDSGAAWIDAQSYKAVALHFAGEDGLEPTAEYALAHALPRVMELLDVSFG